MRLHNYQEVAREFLRGDGRGLFLECGLGKSAIAASALEDRHLPALIVSPKRVASMVWPEELQIWRPDLKASFATGGPKQRRAALRADADVYVIGRDVMKDAVGGPWKTIILDELSSWKSKSASRSKYARHLTKQAPYVFGLTGTPTSNGLMDLWHQVFLLDRGERLGRTLTLYRNRWFYAANKLPNGIVTDWALRPGAAEEIHEVVSDICLSMQAVDHLDLPDVTVNVVSVTLPSAAKAVYRDLKNDLVTGLDDTLGDGVRFSAANAAVLSSRLQQVTAGFLYPDTDDEAGSTLHLHTAKIEALEEIIDGTGSPILVFYQFKEELAMLQERWPHARGIDAESVTAWNRGEVPLLVAHPASAGHGLNLQRGGHTVVWLTQTWSLELWTQANARLNRQGQTHPVVVHVIQAEKTVDVSVHRAVLGKADTHEALMDHLQSPV